jgi:hypothetical protein
MFELGEKRLLLKHEKSLESAFLLHHRTTTLYSNKKAKAPFNRQLGFLRKTLLHQTHPQQDEYCLSFIYPQNEFDSE